MSGKRILIVGGGPAGFFAAIAAATEDPSAQVVLCEATADVLAKVRVSGGGRCNVTTGITDPAELVGNYPRGGCELRGPFHRFGAAEAAAWFRAHGVELKTEPDGRVFPVTDDSRTIVECLRSAAAAAGVEIRLRCAVRGLAPGFLARLGAGDEFRCDRVLLATGGGKAGGGFELARGLGHAIEPPVPSLFTFQTEDPRLAGLAGVSANPVEVRVAGTRLRQTGPLLVTHWGLSGPAVLKLSAWGARILHDRDYRFALVVNWVAPRSEGQVLADLEARRTENARAHVGTTGMFGLPQRLWEPLVKSAGLGPAQPWSSVSNERLRSLARELTAGSFAIAGKSLFKEEFVTCGGVRLAEVDFQTMQSRRQPGLFFAGEVLDIDGVTGGFNFQSAWTTGWIAGKAIVE